MKPQPSPAAKPAANQNPDRKGAGSKTALSSAAQKNAAAATSRKVKK